MEILEDFFKSIAEAIRRKTNKRVKIKPENFADEIRAISTKSLQEKEISITTSGVTNVTPDAGYDALAKVVATPKTQTKNVSITSTETTTITPDSGNIGLAKVVATPTLQAKTGTISSNTTTTYKPDSGYAGLSSVQATTNISTTITYNLPWFYGNSTYTNTVSVPSAKTQAYLVIYAVTRGSYSPLTITGSNCTLSRVNTDADGNPYSQVNNSRRHSTFIYKVTKNAGVTGTITIKSTDSGNINYTCPVLIY